VFDGKIQFTIELSKYNGINPIKIIFSWCY